MPDRPRIVVLGSINMDLVATTPALPQPGETVMGSSFATLPGGKGANQAVAAARLGADVRMIGRVGDDTFGPMLLASLEANGVGAEDVMTTPGLSSGIAVILLDDERQNYIVGIYGANMACDELQLQAASRALEGADALLLQMEIPLDVSLEAAAIARRMGVRVIHDPAPPSELPELGLRRLRHHRSEPVRGRGADRPRPSPASTPRTRRRGSCARAAPGRPS